MQRINVIRAHCKKVACGCGEIQSVSHQISGSAVVPSSGWPCHEEWEKVPFITNKIDHMLVDLISGTVTLCPIHLPVAYGKYFFTRNIKSQIERLLSPLYKSCGIELFSKTCLFYRICQTIYLKTRLECRTQQPFVAVTLTSSLF